MCCPFFVENLPLTKLLLSDILSLGVIAEPLLDVALGLFAIMSCDALFFVILY